MAIDRAIQILFLVAAIFFECYLVFAASLYIPWKSTSYLLVVIAGAFSVCLVTWYILSFDRRAEEAAGEERRSQ